MPGNGPRERARPEMEPGESPVGWVPGCQPLPSPLDLSSPIQRGRNRNEGEGREAFKKGKPYVFLSDLMGMH